MINLASIRQSLFAHAVTQRERAALAAFLLFSGVVVALHAWDVRDRSIHQDHNNPLVTAVQTLDAQRRNSMASGASQARTRAVVAPTYEIALIQAHSLISDYALQADLRDVQIKVLKSSSHESLHLAINAEYRADQLHRFLRAIAASQKSISIDLLQVTATEPQRLKIEMRFAYLKERRP